MPKLQPGIRREGPLEAWIACGRALLEKMRIDEQELQANHVRKPFLQSIANSYWDGIVSHANGMGMSIGQIGARLGIHRGTPYCWDHERLPQPEHIFGALLVAMRVDISEVEFPKKKEVVWTAVRTTLMRIGSKVLGESESLPPTPEEFACVWYYVRHPGTLEVARTKSDESPALATEDTLYEVLRQGRKEFPRITGLTMLRALEKWVHPYLLFRIGLIQDWGWVDEIAV